MVPKDMLVDSFVYYEFQGKGRTHSVQYGPETLVSNVRIDREERYHRDSSEAEVRARATIYCYAQHTTPFFNFKKQSKIEFDGQEYLLKDVRSYTMPFSRNMAVFELDVV